MLRRALVVVLAAAPVIVVPAPAASADPLRVFTGRAGPSHVALSIDRDRPGGLAQIRVRARCEGVAQRVERPAVIPLAPEQTRRGRIRLRGTYGGSAGGDPVFVRLDAVRRARPTRPVTHAWVGSVTARFAHPVGERMVRCRAPARRFRAIVAGEGTGTLEMTSDPGDYVGGGQPWSFASPPALIRATGSRKRLGIGVTGEEEGASWSIELWAGTGETLAAGRTYAMPPGQDGNRQAPGLHVRGDHRSCGPRTGEFTISAARFARDGRPLALDVRFAQFCSADPAAGLRGRVRFRAAR
jgi:hypothetical protein